MKRSITNAQARKLGRIFAFSGLALAFADLVPGIEANATIAVALFAHAAIFFGLVEARNIAEVASGYEGY